ncbi:MAG: tetratricopeptide repeat protein [Candidatus Brocadiia bacterium]
MAVEDLYEKACEAANKGNYEYAIELFREVLRIEPEYPRARVLLRGTERRRKEENDSLTYSLLCMIKGTWPYLRATLCFGDANKKLEKWEDYLEYNPDSSHALLMAGKAARKCGLDEASISILKDVLAVNPEHKGALRTLGNALEEDGRIGEALKYLRRLSDLSPEDRRLESRVKNMQAQAHMQDTHMEDAESFREMIRDEEFAQSSAKDEDFETASEKKQKAMEELAQEIKQDPENVNKIVRLAKMHAEEGDMETALQFLREANNRMPKNFEIRETLGNIRMEICARALKDAEAQLKEKPENEELEERKKKLEEKCKDLTRQEYQWRVEQHPTDRELRLNYGHALFQSGDIKNAMSEFQQAAKDPRLELEGATMLGRCFMEKGQYDLAAEQFERAVDRHPAKDEKGMNLRYLLAMALEKMGDTEKALKKYKEIYSNDINFRDVAEKVEALSE